MSRILKIMIVLLAITAMAAPVVIAEDRLTLGGQMRVRSWHKDFDVKGEGTNTYVDQRLRIGGKLSVAEGVSITFRTDITETQWGAGGSEYGSGRGGATQQWDRAHLDLDLGDFHVRVGQQYVGYGLAQTINSQDAGIKVSYNDFSAFLLLDDQNGDSNALAAGNNADSFLFGANYGHKGDNYKANLFFGLQNDSHPGVVDFENVALDDSGEELVYMIGVDLVYNLDAFKIAGEFNYFTGDASNDTDAFGTQLMLDVSMAATETLTVGGQFYYAAGDDEDRQYTYLGNDFNGYDPLFDVGTSLSNEQIGAQRPFDLAKSLIGLGIGVSPEAETLGGNTSTGVVGGRVYTNFKATDAIDLGASFAYMTPEEDKHFKDFDSAMFWAVSASYAVMSNTSLQAQVQYVDADVKQDVDSAFLTGVGLFVNF